MISIVFHDMKQLCAVVVGTGVLLAVQSGGIARAAYVFDPSGGSQATLPEARNEHKEVDGVTTCFERGEFTQCLDLLGAARKKNPDMFPAEVILAELHLRVNQVTQARAALEHAAVGEPGCPQTYFLLGKLALAEGRTAEATALFEKVRTLAGSTRSSEAVRKEFQASASAGLATVAERRGDWPAASACLTELTEYNPTDGQARGRLARALFLAGKREKVRDELQRAQQDDPTLDPPALIMANLYTEVGEIKKAAEWVEYAQKTAPRDARAQLGAALWYLERDQPERARGAAETAARLDPASAEIKVACGLIAWHLKNYPEAERLFQEIVIEAPGNIGASSMWALALAEQPALTKRRRALQLAEALARMDPNSGTALTTLGRVYHKNGRPDDAERALRAALASGTVSSDAPYYLARVLADRGHEAEIAPLLKMSLAAPGRFAFRGEAREWLARIVK